MAPRVLPHHRRIYEHLLYQIQHGGLNPGDTVPTERELQERFGVSRVPVRQALARLEAEGLIRRTPGRGTEVLHPRVGPMVRLSGFAHFYNRMADQISSRILAVETVPAEAEVADHLGLPPGAPVLQVQRLRLVQGSPTAYMVNHFVPTEMRSRFLDAHGPADPLHEFILPMLPRAEVDVQEDLQAVLADPAVAAMLLLPAGAPVLAVTRRGWDRERVPVEFSRYWARTDVSSYRTFLSTNQGGD